MRWAYQIRLNFFIFLSLILSSPDIHDPTPREYGRPEWRGLLRVLRIGQSISVRFLDQGGLPNAHVPQYDLWQPHPDRQWRLPADPRCPEGGCGLLHLFRFECCWIGHDSSVPASHLTRRDPATDYWDWTGESDAVQGKCGHASMSFNGKPKAESQVDVRQCTDPVEQPRPNGPEWHTAYWWWVLFNRKTFLTIKWGYVDVVKCGIVLWRREEKSIERVLIL